MRFGSVFGNNEVSFWQYLLIFNEILLFNEIYFVVRNQEILIPLVCIMQVPLTKRQCFLLICAGSFSHFFLDHLFEVIFFLSPFYWYGMSLSVTTIILFIAWKCWFVNRFARYVFWIVWIAELKLVEAYIYVEWSMCRCLES